MEHANEVNINTWKLDVDSDHLPEEVFLPTVTEEDAGKVLMAFSDGVWRMKKFSGVTPTLPYVEETYDSNDNLIDVKLVGHTVIRNNAFYGCTNLALTSLPSGITSIGNSAFNGCTNLALASLPSGLTSIGITAFYKCTNLALTSLPSGITSIGDYAFFNCTNLTSITFEGTPITISSKAFNGCINLTTINVPWAEGEVANAPWGAANAIINYNHIP